MPRERLPIDSWRDERFGSSLQQELQLVGGNLRFAFTAALADQLGWPVSRPEYEALQKRAAQRARFEPVFSVRTMLQTVAGEPLSGEQGEDYVPEVSVFYYLRRLMPRIEEVAPNSG
jgi:hypothetical protein